MAEKRYVNVFDESGVHRGHVPVEQAGELPAGMRAASPEEDEQIGLEAEYGGLGDTIAAGAVSLIGGATAGLGTAAIAELGGEDVRRTLEAYQRVSPIASGAGELAGALLGTVALGGGGAVRGAARALSAPSRAIVRAGGAVEGAFGGQRLLGTVARGAVEGGLYSAGKAVSESSIEDTDLTGEKLFAAMRHGALLGGGLGLGIGSVGAGLRGAGRIARRALERPGSAGAGAVVGAQFGGAAAPGVRRRLAEWWADSASVLTGADREAIIELASTPGALQDALQAGKIKGVVVDDVASHLDDILPAADDVFEKIRNSGFKKAEIARIVRRGNEADTALATRSQLVAIRQRLDEMIAAPERFGGSGAMKQIRAAVDDIANEAEAAIKAGSDVNAELFSALDRAKRAVGPYTKQFTKTAATTAKPAWQKSSQALRDLYEDLRVGLEDAALWGGAAEAQRAINKPISELLGVNGAFKQNFTATLGKDPRMPWLDKRVADRAKIERYVNSLTNPGSDLTHRSLTEYLGNLGDATDAIARTMDLTPAQASAVETIRGSVSALRGKVDRATEVVTRANQLSALEQSARESSTLGAVFGGGLIGGAPGAMLGAAASAFMNPARTLRQIGAVQSLAGRITGKVDTGIKRLAGQRSADPVTQAARVLAEQHGEYERRANRVRAFAAQAPDLDKQLRSTMGELAHGAPQTAGAALETARRASSLLFRTLPSSEFPTHLLGTAEIPSREDMRRWIAQARGAEDPENVVEDIVKGRLDLDTLEATKETYPKLFGEIQEKLMQQLADVQSAGDTLPYQTRVQLGMVLDVPVEPTMDPELMQMMAATYAQQGRPAEAGGQTKSPKLSQFYEPTTTRLDERRY